LLDSTSIRKAFGWSDQMSLEEGLTETLAWVDGHLNRLKTLPWKYSHQP